MSLPVSLFLQESCLMWISIHMYTSAISCASEKNRLKTYMYMYMHTAAVHTLLDYRNMNAYSTLLSGLL